MGEFLSPIGEGEQHAKEVLHPGHFYAAYVFDKAETRRRDVSVLMEHARGMGLPFRYWWLSEAMDLEGASDRLIVCVHHPTKVTEDVNAGMDLYNALKERQVSWDDLEMAAFEEYAQLGKSISGPESIFDPDGIPVYPSALDAESERLSLFTLTRQDVQYAAQQELGRDLTNDEVSAVLTHLRRVIDLDVDLRSLLKQSIKDCQSWGEVGPAVVGDEQEEDDPEVHVRQLPNSGWPECFDSDDEEYAHLCNAVHVFEGIDYDGQLYVRREWGLRGEPPSDFTAHDWGPAYVPESSDTLETVLADLDRMVEKGVLSLEERARSEAFYRRLFPSDDPSHY